jgi:hypothetical protein
MDSTSFNDTSLIKLSVMSPVSEERDKLTHQTQSNPISVESITKVKTMTLNWGIMKDQNSEHHVSQASKLCLTVTRKVLGIKQVHSIST